MLEDDPEFNYCLFLKLAQAVWDHGDIPPNFYG